MVAQRCAETGLGTRDPLSDERCYWTTVDNIQNSRNRRILAAICPETPTRLQPASNITSPVVVTRSGNAYKVPHRLRYAWLTCPGSLNMFLLGVGIRVYPRNQPGTSHSRRPRALDQAGAGERRPALQRRLGQRETLWNLLFPHQ
jgi:hypothetical protein